MVGSQYRSAHHSIEKLEEGIGGIEIVVVMAAAGLASFDGGVGIDLDLWDVIGRMTMEI